MSSESARNGGDGLCSGRKYPYNNVAIDVDVVVAVVIVIVIVVISIVV